VTIPILSDPPIAAFRTVDGQIWLGDEKGLLCRGRPSVRDGVESVQRMGTIDFPIVSLDGGPRMDGETEVFMMSAAGEVARFSGSQFSRIAQLPSTQGGVVWAGEGEVLVRTTVPGAVHRIRDGRTAEERLPDPAGLISMSFLAGLGVLAGTADGAFYFRDSGGIWSKLPGIAGWWVTAISPYEDGFAYLLASGFVGQYRKGRFCEPLQVLPISSDGNVVPLGADLLILGKVPGALRYQGAVLPRAVSK
jgi:hypothetical protein